MYPTIRPTVRFRLRAGATMLAFAFGLTACGGGGGDSNPPATTPSNPSTPAPPAVQAPAITAQPAAQTAAPSQSATFSVTATGTGLAYQWQRDGKDIAGATSASYTVNNVQAADSGASFTVVVKNSAGSVTSAAAALTVAVPKGLSLVAGAIGGPGNLDGLDGRLEAPEFIAFTPAGLLQVADNPMGLTLYRYDNDRQDVVRTVDPASGAIATSNEGPLPGGLVTLVSDRAGNRFDVTGSAIYRTAPGGQRTVFAGSATEGGNIDGAGAAARFSQIVDAALDAQGNLYVADGSFVRQVTPAGVVSTLAGSVPPPGFVSQQLDGTGAQAQFIGLRSLAVDRNGNIVVLDFDKLRTVTPAGAVTTRTLTEAGQAGAVAFKSAGAGHLAGDAAGNVYVVENVERCRIRKVTPDGAVTDLAGSATSVGNVDGKGAAASFCANGPIPPFNSRPLSNLAMDAAGNLYLADGDNRTIRRITPGGDVTTVGGRPANAANVDAVGANARFALSPLLMEPNKLPVYPYYALATDAGGNIYVGEGDRIRQVFPNGAVGTLVHPDNAGKRPLILPSGLAYGGSAIVISDNRIGRVDASGAVKYMAGQQNVGGNADGPGAQATLNYPTDAIADGLGNIYFTDRRVGLTDTVDPSPLERKIAPDGTVTTLTQPQQVHKAWFADKDGTVWDLTGDTIEKIGVDGRRSAVLTPIDVRNNGVAVAFTRDGAGNFYIGMHGINNDYYVYKVTPSGDRSIIAGAGKTYGVRLGSPGSLGPIDGLAAGPDGTVYVLSENAVLRIVQ